MKTRFILFLTLLLSASIAAQDFKFGKVSKEELQEKQHPSESDAGAAVLYREYVTNFDYSGAEGFFIKTEVFERIKIYNREGFDYANKEIKIHKNGRHKESITGLKGTTYNLDASGKVTKDKLKSNAIFEEDRSDYLTVQKFTFPNIKEGSVIEYKYTLTSPFIQNIEAYPFQEKIPVKNVEVTFMVPEYLVYKPHKRGWINFNIDAKNRQRTIVYSYTKIGAMTSGGGGADKDVRDEVKLTENIYKVSLTNVPGFKIEPFTGNYKNYLSGLKFELSHTKFPNEPYKNFSTTWEAVTQRIYESSYFGVELNKTGFLKEDINQLTASISDTNQKVVQIFEYLKNRMNWNSYIGKYTQNGVRKAYKDKTGNVADINLLLTAMLREAGIDANPILVSTKSNGIPLYPTIEGFNYVITGVEMQNQVWLLDATDKMNEINVLDPQLINWKGRIVRKDGSSSWVSLTPPAATDTYLVNATIENGNTIKGKVQSRFTENLAKEIRKNHFNIKNEESVKKIKQGKGDTDISNLTIDNITTLYKPVNVVYDFVNKDALEIVNDKLLVYPILFLVDKENKFIAEDRKYPVDFKYPFKNRYMINIEIPEGYTIESKPENTSFTFGDQEGIFRYTLKNIANKLQLSAEISINTPSVTPDKYATLKGFYQLLFEKLNEPVVLIKQ
jgi:hypothetical protein